MKINLQNLKIKIQVNFLYLLVLFVSILICELIIDTNWIAFLPAILLAYYNFFKILALSVAVNFFAKWFKKINFNFLLKFLDLYPNLLYNAWLMGYVVVSLIAYWNADNIMFKKTSLISAISMFLSIIIGNIAYYKNLRKSSWIQDGFFYILTCKIGINS